MAENTLRLESAHVPQVSRSHEWSTPLWLFNELNEEFAFTLDACASPLNAKCRRFYSTDDDGLSQSWRGEVVWMNPPYSRGVIDRWMKKAFEESRERRATVVCLVPSSTSTAWWHNWAMKGEIRFVKGRIRFGGAAHDAMFPCSLIVFRTVGAA